jgi:hypothetical protein
MKLKAANVEFLIFKARIREGTVSELEDFILHKIVGKNQKTPEAMGSEKKSQNSMEKSFLNSAKVVLCTCTAAGDERLEKFQFQTIIIDEAAHYTEPTAMIPIQLGVRRLRTSFFNLQTG